jgi:hypothetical protein
MGHVREENVTITFQDYLFFKYNITGKRGSSVIAG